MALSKGNQADPGGGPPAVTTKTFSQAVRGTLATSIPTATFTESTLVNALTFDFRAHKGSLPDLLKQVGAHYTGQIASLVKHNTMKCAQIGFKREIDLGQIIHDGFAIDNQVVPKYRCFRNVANIMRLRASRLPGQNDDRERAEITKALSPYGKVLDIFYFREPLLGVNSSHGIIQLDRTPVEGKVYEDLVRKAKVAENKGEVAVIPATSLHVQSGTVPVPVQETSTGEEAVSNVPASPSSGESGDGDVEMLVDEPTEQPTEEPVATSPSQTTVLRRSQRIKEKEEKLAAEELSVSISTQAAQSKTASRKKGRGRQ